VDFREFLTLLVEMETQGWQHKLESLPCERVSCRNRNKRFHFHVRICFKLNGIKPDFSLLEAIAVHLKGERQAKCGYADSRVPWDVLADLCTSIDISHDHSPTLFLIRQEIVTALQLSEDEIRELYRRANSRH
jgi:hypothetical protein